MIFSTLPDLPGRTYDVIGVVVSQTWLRPNGDDSELHEMFNHILRQASDMGADAVIDIKMTAPSGTDRPSPAIVVIGTAVKLR
jgi:hypothetical protein